MYGGTGPGFARLDSVYARTVYPRVYGGTGSTGNDVAQSLVGSIPACTGEPIKLSRPLRLRFFGVYPRVYGGTTDYCCWHDSTSGLSPRVRGNLVVNLGAPSGQGSIPACTGEPHDSPGESLHALVQRSIPACTGEPAQPELRTPSSVNGLSPRVRGNLIARGILQLGEIRLGLSPRVRGNQRARSNFRSGAVTGSIPACTGEPVCRAPSLRLSLDKVYPRVYGGTSTEFIRLFAAVSLFSGV